jgi:hypothetical protein
LPNLSQFRVATAAQPILEIAVHTTAHNVLTVMNGMNFHYGVPAAAVKKSSDDIIYYDLPTVTNTFSRRNAVTRSDAPQYMLPEGYEPTSLDICCGRGKRNWNHLGNVSFRNLIQSCSDAYMMAPTKNDKTAIVFKIVEDMRLEGCKFLKQQANTGRWLDIGDAQAREKVGHSLRDQVTAFNRQNKKLGENVKLEELEPNRVHIPLARRGSLALSDSGNEGEQRRMSLDTTPLISSFARRPSWVAMQETTLLDGIDETPMPPPPPPQALHPPQQSSLQLLTPQQQEQMEHMGDVPSELTRPIGRTRERRRSTYEYLEKFDFYVAPNPEFEQSFSSVDAGAMDMEGSVAEAEAEDVYPTASNPSIDRSSLFRNSLQTWDPRASSSSSSILSVRRSAMSGGTTLRRLTNSRRISDITMSELMMDGEFTPNDLAFYFEE